MTTYQRPLLNILLNGDSSILKQALNSHSTQSELNIVLAEHMLYLAPILNTIRAMIIFLSWKDERVVDLNTVLFRPLLQKQRLDLMEIFAGLGWKPTEALLTWAVDSWVTKNKLNEQFTPVCHWLVAKGFLSGEQLEQICFKQATEGR